MRSNDALVHGVPTLRKEGRLSTARAASHKSASLAFRRVATPRPWKLFAFVVALLLSPCVAQPQQAPRVVADNISYNIGDTVRLAVLNLVPASQPAHLVATLRYAGETKPVYTSTLSLPAVRSGTAHANGYFRFWQVPPRARTGRYEIDLEARDSKSQQVVLNLPAAASFAVHRKLVQIDRIKLDKSVYTSGDPVGCKITLINRSSQPLAGLRVEFSDRYWPWIAQSSERADIDVRTLGQNLSLAAKRRFEAGNSECAVAKAVKQPAIHQFAAVVWDQGRRRVLDIAFSPLVVIHPPGVDSPQPYPLQYLYPDLSAVNTSSYRHFYPPETVSAAIQFDPSHTMFASGGEAEVNFTLQNPTPGAWRGASISARLLDENGKQIQKIWLATGLNLEPGAPPLPERATFALPAQASGVYRVEVAVTNATGENLAQASLELGVNPLPQSILIFCAHEDDEMAHAGIIRAAVENRIPLHLVYFTSGDAGSCDRYYQHSCSPAGALSFGALRMEEARAALGHLGVPREDILFLGLPDGGSGDIWFRHRESSDPYLSVLLASDHAPYGGLVRANLPYARRPVLAVVKELIRKYQPAVIYTGHPDERHVDHCVNNWLVVKALQELADEGAAPPGLSLLTDQVYGSGPQTHAPYQYQKNILHVSGEAMRLAQEAGWFYQSQSGNRAEGNLRTFGRLPRTETHWQVLDWKEHEGWNEKN